MYCILICMCLNLYFALAVLFFYQDREIEGSGRTMFESELQTANGMSEVLVSIQLFPFASCYSSQSLFHLALYIFVFFRASNIYAHTVSQLQHHLDF
jgi:hypothetical protein